MPKVVNREPIFGGVLGSLFSPLFPRFGLWQFDIVCKGQILRSTSNTAPLTCGACNTQPEGLLTTGYYYPRFYMGLPEGEKKELGEVLSCGICFDGRYYAVSGRCTVDRKNFICYDVVTGTRLSLGDRVTYEGRGKQLRLCPCNGKPDVLHDAGRKACVHL